MASLYKDENGNLVQTIRPDFANIQNVTVGAASAATASAIPKDANASHPMFQGALRLVMIISTTACWFRVGANPTAAKDNTSIYLPANVYAYVPVLAGTDKIAFIQDAAGGTAQVIPAL